MPETSEFEYDVFLSHSAKDKDIVRDVANRLKSDGVRVWLDEDQIKSGDSIPAKIEAGLEQSRVLVLCLSQAALAADWPQLESHTFRFKDPLNHNRRFIPLRLDDAPTKGSLAQFSYIDWRPDQHEEEYPKLLQACRRGEDVRLEEAKPENQKVADTTRSFLNSVGFHVNSVRPDGTLAIATSNGHSAQLWKSPTGKRVGFLDGHIARVTCASWSQDLVHAASGSSNGEVRIWDTVTKSCLRVLAGHSGIVQSVVWSSDNHRVVTGSEDMTIRVWDALNGSCIRILETHGVVECVDANLDANFVVSGGEETVSQWDVASQRCLIVLEGHTGYVSSVALHNDERHVVSGSDDGTIRLWDLSTGHCLRVLAGHRNRVTVVLWCDHRHALSGSSDKSLRLWDMVTGRCLCEFSGHAHGVISATRASFGGVISSDSFGFRTWDLSSFIDESGPAKPLTLDGTPIRDQVQYTNAKVLLVGNSAAGKTGLSNRLALGAYKETDSTVGAWATHWKIPMPDVGGESDEGPSSKNKHSGQHLEREVWLWDFGGQADQRLIHQLYMDQTQVAALVFDPQKDDVFEALGQWDRDLSRIDKDKTDQNTDGSSGARMTKLLVAGRCDAGGLRVARRQIDDFVADRGYAAYVETSAKKDIGCAELKQAIIDGIQWENIPWRSSPVLFKRLKDEIIKLKDEGRVLMRFNELREMLALRMSHRKGEAPAEPVADGESVERLGGSLALPNRNRFTDAELKAVLGLLAGPGVVWELEFGSWVLLQPERINAYAQAVITTIRQDEHDRGCISEQRVLKGDLTYHSSIDRLPPDEQQFVLLAMHQILVERGLCIRHQTETGEMLLIFPSYYRRERRDLVNAPSVVVSYRFNGFLDDVYATLVVKLEHTREFNHDELWRYAADFKTNDGKQLGVKLTRLAEGEGELDVYFAPDVLLGERIIFSKYIHEHLLHTANDVVRLRHYVCHNKYRGGLCNTTANREVAMERLEEHGQQATINCQRCNETLNLWDELERQFADPATKQRVHDLRAAVEIVLDTESKERVLVGEVISTAALAGQICREVQVSDWGIDAEIEFKDDDGNATARKVYLQLKSGDSFLTTRQRDDAEIFKSFNQRQAEYWMNHEFPVFLIIRNSTGTIRWMEVRDYLRRATNDGERQVRQIEFAGTRFDVMSVRRWREDALSFE